MHHIDVSTAFLNAPLDESVYVMRQTKCALDPLRTILFCLFACSLLAFARWTAGLVNLARQPLDLLRR